MWSPAAQHNTIIAAQAAGFGSRPQDIIESVTEPEAAASYALREINSIPVRDPDVSSGWQVGKQVIMCDAGGGTVDLVSYAIDQVNPYLRVSETTRPQELIDHGIRDLLPDSNNGIDREYITLSHEDMKSIFDPVVDKILALVENVLQKARIKQPDKPVVGIILVGGFGESVYLYERLNTWARAQDQTLFASSPRNS
ncbi:hypothetical protein FALCPG4_017353 [Fusarium falciforme]